ncbi:SH3 domain-containing protein [Sphingomonas adhaesiva]|uniref:SH3 domain-containing protein n=1 Tax=Sphingomonas adhaesiva TaxID=28212 RepID=UPI002FFB615E
MRPDIADVRLADQVFAPHYAAPVRRTLRADAALREGRDDAAPVMVELRAGDAFDLLDVTGGVAWGIAIGPGLVGYLDAALVAA